ncbi:cytochrome P450 6a2 [Tribolium castaneum]|uniref:cytochrome P450 6a2 n=1 Tax=Tribolium castaneum TaxID=7070 RepID=UPI0000D561F2|nr:PREDICTED: cytochrome P450 6a2 [Tribolium castaneum]|eukprot:XP_968751.1 PREDICTED: cytochrome P450 6a2 [Tribolium castaneum]
MFKFDVFNTGVFELVCLFISLSIVSWYLYYIHCFNYWKKKQVPTHPPQFPAGNILKPVLGRENLFISVENYYKEFKRKGYKHAGLYFLNGPVYLPIDPEIVKSILTTDFDHFIDRGVFVDEQNFPLSAHLFSIKGSKWRSLRTKLSPTFSSGKLKTMYEIFMKMTQNFIETLEPKAGRKEDINIKYIAANFTADIIFSTAFGLEGNTLQYPDSKLGNLAKNLFNPSTWIVIKSLALEGLQNPGSILRAFISNKSIEEFFVDLVKKTVKHRDENKVVRKDFLSLLLEIRDREGLSFNEIVAQCFLFFLAGFETSSQTISYTIHSLAYNQDVQDKLRKEIVDNLGSDFTKYTYDDVLKLPYLDKVFNETLRLYPVLGFLNRICVKPYKVPGTDVVLDVGTPVLISTLGLQRDPEYFPNPFKFDPERFSEDNSQVPFTFMPFGEGPRFCIGMRYGKLQTKLGIASLVSQFRFKPSPETPEFIEFDKFSKSLAMSPVKGITVKIEKL